LAQSGSPGLGEAAGRFLASLPSGDKATHQQEVYRFVRWFGWERPCASLTPADVGKYAGQVSQADADFKVKLEQVRAFLAYVRKQGWSNTSLAAHVKIRQGRGRTAAPVGKAKRRPVPLTRQGYEELRAELERLRARSLELVADIQRAAADKDFRENAPLAAAREERGQVEGRIAELTEMLASAVIIEENQAPGRTASLGCEVVLRDLDSGAEVCYTLVGPREVDIPGGKISTESPLGRAILGKTAGATVEITVPAGRMRYQVVRVCR